MALSQGAQPPIQQRPTSQDHHGPRHPEDHRNMMQRQAEMQPRPNSQIRTEQEAPIGLQIWKDFNTSCCPVQVLAVFQIIVGVLCNLLHFGIIAVFETSLKVNGIGYQVGAPIWCGIFFIVTGAFGLKAAASKTTCHILTFMVMSITCASGGVISLLATSGIDLRALQYQILTKCSFWVSILPPECNKEIAALLALNSILIVLTVVEFIVAIFSAVKCCQTVCYSHASPPPHLPLHHIKGKYAGHHVKYGPQGGHPGAARMGTPPGQQPYQQMVPPKHQQHGQHPAHTTQKHSSPQTQRI